ncbi:hypothetical protein PGTUg99_030398 [Puccinia graminis f. sp. tritici]|uniref:Uncharacterized protein n=1 Tax=Puccinia graminis f. sp. tritici TaxID=56615 RepID=A0A5B0RV12_PUCGR|nr:hypothetical protein PGTUg99_030398 [Puccinia graminis f. sp. tritici]
MGSDGRRNDGCTSAQTSNSLQINSPGKTSNFGCYVPKLWKVFRSEFDITLAKKLVKEGTLRNARNNLDGLGGTYFPRRTTTTSAQSEVMVATD